MKRILTVFLTLTVLLGLLPVISIPAAAADVPGDWTTYRAASEYLKPGEEDSDKVYKPEAGYKYTDEGFTVVPADYTDSTPYMTVQTKEPQPVQEGLYLEFRVDDYSYKGPENNVDSWICISITNKQKVNPGTTTYGGGWLCLIRGTGGGAEALVESFNTVETTETYAGAFQHLGNSNVKPGMDNADRELYTFEATYSGSQYTFKLNGVTLNNMSAATSNLKNLDPNGEFYVGITMYSSVKDGTAALSILNYGTNESNAKPPVGNDSKEPEPNLIKVAEIADPSTVAENQPALYWDAATVENPTGTNVSFSPLGDNAYRLNMSGTLGYFSWNIPRTVSYASTDFPVLAVMLRNFQGGGGTLWYYSGNILGATDTNNTPWTINDGFYYASEDDEYILITIDLSELWEGRIHGIRFDFAVPEDALEFDICYMGFFRSYDEADQYSLTRLAEWGVVDDEQETESDTPAEDTETQQDPAVTEAPTAAATQPEETAEPTVTDPPKTEKGCGSVVGLGSVALTAVLSAGVLLRKRKE